MPVVIDRADPLIEGCNDIGQGSSFQVAMVLVKRGADWMIVNHHSSQRPKEPLQ